MSVWERGLEVLAAWNRAVNGLVWGPPGLALLLGAGLYLTVRSGLFPLRHAGLWLRCTLGTLFARQAPARPERGRAGLSPFQSVCTALAASLGTGNIVGVATAILNGGPGAVFWMWVMALLGMMTGYTETVLGVCYRQPGAHGGWVGGPMYYLRDGLGARPGCRAAGRALAACFAAACVLASFGIGNMSQANAIAENLRAAFGVPPWLTGLALAAVCGAAILGGLQRVAAVTEKLVPLMAAGYIAGAAVVLLSLHRQLPAAVASIFQGALGLRAAAGGTAGYAVRQAVGWGLRRGAFSNEAGLGSAVMAHASADTREPVQQGMWGIFAVFLDTIVVCTLTALVLLTSGVTQPGGAAVQAGAGALVGQAFGRVFGAAGPAFLAAAVLLFACSTILGWSHYGTVAFAYLFGERAAAAYRGVFAAAVFCGAVLPLELVWALSDTFNGLMMVPNLVGVLALSGGVMRHTQAYLARQQGPALGA